MTPRQRKAARIATAAPMDAPNAGEILAVASVPIESVVPYSRNPRKNETAIAKVAASLRAFGFRQPIVVDRNMIVIAGHTRLEAARLLGMANVPVHIASDLETAGVQAYRITDNRTGAEAAWDDELLRGEVVELKALEFDLGVLGFDAPELAEFFRDNSAVLFGADVDDAPATPAEPITQPGDCIRLGRHVLVCADALEPVSWEMLLSGQLAGLVWTDPPYGVSYGDKNAMLNAQTGGHRITTPIGNDALTAGELQTFLRTTLTLAFDHTRAGASWYIAAPPGPLQAEFTAVLAPLNMWRHTLIWVKSGFVLGRSDYHYRHEPIFYGWKDGAAHTWRGGRSQDSVLEFARPNANKLHPTMKPVALVQRCIENSTNAGDIVVDPFAGSGSTLIAAEAAGRRAAVMELSPAYCDVIVQRWETVTGARAVRPT